MSTPFAEQAAVVFDVVVVGAGAAGMVAAFRAAERGRRTCLLEKNARPGVKILMSGGTRCNLTQATNNRGIVAAFGPPGKFLYSALAALGVAETIQLFESEGVATKVENTGKVFPASDKASQVLAALRARLDRSGAQLVLGEPLEQLDRVDGIFHLRTPTRAFQAEHVLLTTGGQSYPGCGTTGDGYRFAAALGHSIVPPRPALVPLTTHAAWVRALRGVTLPDVALTVVDGAVLERSKVLARRRGSLLFAHFGLTGPVALDVSRVVSGHARPADLRVQIDLAPDRKEDQLRAELQESALDAGRKHVAAVLSQWMPKRLSDIVLERAQIPVDRKLAEHSKAERAALARTLKALDVPLAGTMGFRKAEVTAGGVDLREVDSATLESKRTPGLFFAGEVLDLDGPIGGYNFQAAWSTGWLAGSHV